MSQTQRVESGYSFWDTHQCWDTHWPPAGTLLTQVVGHGGATMMMTGILAISEIVPVTSLLEVVTVF